MSNMRLTMTVHSVDGDEKGQQDIYMQVAELPEMDRETAFELMERLGTHIDDELKAIDELNTEANSSAGVKRWLEEGGND